MAFLSLSNQPFPLEFIGVQQIRLLSFLPNRQNFSRKATFGRPARFWIFFDQTFFFAL
jgi:hypothetical protein